MRLKLKKSTPDPMPQVVESEPKQASTWSDEFLSKFASIGLAMGHSPWELEDMLNAIPVEQIAERVKEADELTDNLGLLKIKEELGQLSTDARRALTNSLGHITAPLMREPLQAGGLLGAALKKLQPKVNLKDIAMKQLAPAIVNDPKFFRTLPKNENFGTFLQMMKDKDNSQFLQQLNSALKANASTNAPVVSAVP